MSGHVCVTLVSVGGPTLSQFISLVTFCCRCDETLQQRQLRRGSVHFSSQLQFADYQCVTVTAAGAYRSGSHHIHNEEQRMNAHTLLFSLISPLLNSPDPLPRE